MARTLITTATAASDASLAFTSSIDSTYKLYIFSGLSIEPETNGAYLEFHASTDGGSNYGQAITTTFFAAAHAENDSSAYVSYQSDRDAAQSGEARITSEVGTTSDESASFQLFLFNPSNATYVKHFTSTSSTYQYSNYANRDVVAGYINTATAINTVKFQFTAGDFDGVIKMYGVG